MQSTTRRPRAVPGAALVLALAAVHCTVTTGDDAAGLEVHIGMSAPGGAGPQWVAADGATVTLEDGWLAVASTAIFTCDDGPWSRGSALEGAAAWLGPRPAWAHTTSSPRRLGVPGVLPMAPPADVDLELGTLHPPPGRYCEVRVGLGPADADAVGLPEGGASSGHTLVLEGTIRLPDGSEQPFAVASDASIEVVVPCAFTLADGGPRAASLVLSLSPAALLEGVAPGALRDGTATASLLDRAAAALRCQAR